MHGRKQFVGNQSAHSLGRDGPKRSHEKCGLLGFVGKLSNGIL